MDFPDLLTFLNFYADKGYQIVFDDIGIRVWYMPTFANAKLYEGDYMNEAMVAIENHYQSLDQDIK